MPEIPAIAEISWTDPRVLFLLGLVLASILGVLVFAALRVERRRMQAASRQEDAERLGRAFAGTGLCFWDWDIRNGVFSYDQEWFAEHLGYDDPHQELGLDFIGSITHSDDIATKNEALYSHLVGESDSYSAEFRLRRKSGSWVWILSRGKVFERGGEGRALRFAGADSIIEDQKTAEMILKIEKEVSVGFGEVYTADGILQTVAEGLMQLPDFEFSAVFWRNSQLDSLEKTFSSNLPAELAGVSKLEREASSNPVHYYDESHLGPLAGVTVESPISVTEIQIIRSGRVDGCLWVGSEGRYYAPAVIIEAIEQLEVQAQGALDRIESESFYRAGQRNLNTLINSIDEMIFILDRDYRIIYINEIVGAELGTDREDVLGTDLLDLMPENTRQLARDNFADLATGNLPICSAQFLKKRGGVILAEVQITTGRWGESDALFCVVRDAGKRDEATRALEQRDKRLRLASKALVELITASDMEKGIREAIDQVASGFEADRICVSEKTEEEEEGLARFIQLCCWEGDSPTVNLNAGGKGAKIIESRAWTEKLRQGQTITIIRDNCSEEDREYLEKIGVRSLILVPIHLREKWWGVMGAEMRDEIRDWSSGDTALLEIVGSGLAGLVETVRLQRDLMSAKDETEKTNLELGEAIQHAQEMAAEASQANHSKTEFLANMSHEIRTPMNAILGFSELLESEINEPDLVEFLRAIQSSGRTLLALINDLLDLSKIEAGKMSLQYEPISLADLIQDMLNIFQVKCDENGISLESEIDENLPPQLVLDEARIRQIIFNLLGNAVKFTHEGKVDLRVSSRPNPAAAHKVDIRIEVADTGIGIRKEDQDSIFKPFEQSKGQKQKDYGGTGLGLSITTRLVKMMNGKLSLSSTYGKGTSFVVDLYEVEVVRTDSNVSSPLSARNAVADSFQGTEVLVVDDNALNRRVLAASLRGLDITIREAANGVECLEMIAKKKPDMILLDIMMPGLSGGEVAEKIHSMEENKDIPIVACTALDLPRATKISETARFNDILIKPISQVSLKRVLNQFLASSTQADAEGGTEKKTVDGEKSAESHAGASADQAKVLLQKIEEEFEPNWEKLRKRSQMEPILKASKQLKKLGDDFSVPELADYAKELEDLIGIFNVDRLKESMRDFPQVIESIRKKYLTRDLVKAEENGGSK